MNKYLIEQLGEEKIFPIIRSKKADVAINIAKSLADAGIKIIEVNVETPEIYGAIKEISSFIDVCAGGIITSFQANAAIDCGAKLLSSPIFQMSLVKISKDVHIPLIAGASTANEAYVAWKARVPLIKLYPITAIGGVLYVEDLLRPMPFLKVLVQGNVKINEIQAYLDAGAYAVGVGRDLYEGYSYSEITKRTKYLLKQIRS
jgi:2-dehydro-3-deoxyphosphogluconate aldolase/(4S)-4-hydroxy-2-oxoglutarate aldolase